MKQAVHFNKNMMFIGLMAVIAPLGWTACGQKSFESQISNSIVDPTCLQNPSLTGCTITDDTLLLTTQTTVVKANADVDVLFVVDNSGSMEDEQIGIGNKINGFLDKVKNLNWQIALTTTDPNTLSFGRDGTARAWGDGQFRPFDAEFGSQFILRSTQTTAASAQSLLANAIYVGSKGSGAERGINATYRAIERSTNTSSAHYQFFRPEARLAIVLISDEDECSTGPATGCADKYKSVPQNLLNMVQQRFGSSKVFSFNSIVDLNGCSIEGKIGHTYKQLSAATGGTVGTVCSTDFTSQLASIGSKVVELVKTVSLSCVPQDGNGDGKPEFAITKSNGAALNVNYTLNGSTVTFANALPEGSYNLKFYCKP